ncbi:hypothetical protein Tco_0502375 [Tanacetum coccineum]
MIKEVNIGMMIPLDSQGKLWKTLKDEIASLTTKFNNNPKVLDEPNDNSGSSSSLLYGFDDEVQDVSNDEKKFSKRKKVNAEVAEKQARYEQPV